MILARSIKFAKIALVSLQENKKQSILTMLGIVIGISAVIAILALGKGAERLILASVEGFGNRSIFIQPGGGTQGGPPSPTAIDKVKYKDYLAVKQLDYLTDVSPIMVRQTTVGYESETQNTRVIGTDTNYLSSMKTSVVSGRNFQESDMAGSAKVALLGLTTARELFGDQNPLGQKIKINGLNFEVIGVLERQGIRFFQDFDKRVLVPITTMRASIYGVDYVTNIMASVPESVRLEDAIEDLRFFVRKRHALVNPENDPNKDDFKVVSQVDAAKTFQGISDAISIFLVMVAAISLLVGGIGIMNIMFVSVSERTREIGLRKAVGATNSDIMLQFLIESCVLTFVAGVIGVLFGIGFAYLASVIIQSYNADWQFIITWESVTVAFVVSVLIGLVFGLYPARSASRLSPIEALRTE